MESLNSNWEIFIVKPLVQSPPKRPQFCKIHEGTGQGVKNLLTIFTKKWVKVFMLLRWWLKCDINLVQ